jgi:hypothetical protein
MILLTILGLILVAASAVAESIMDKIQFHYDKSIFSQDNYKQTFWNPNLSWVNKWKDSSAKQEKFLGSSTIFVFTTDAWHLFKFFRNTFLFIGLPLLSFGSMNIILAAILARVIYGLVFTICFDKLLIK